MRPAIDPQAAAREELATPLRYHLQAAPPSGEPLWQRLLDAIGNVLAKLFSLHAGNGAGNVAVLVGLLAASALLVYLAARFLAAAPRKRRTGVVLEELTAERAEHGFARRAFAAAERGDFVAAARLLLRAAVTVLDLRGAIRDEASATIGELRAEALRYGENVAAPFGRITSAYVTGVYAQRPVDEAAWLQARDAYEAIRSAQR